MKQILLDIYNLAETDDIAATVTSKTGRYADARGPSVLEIYEESYSNQSIRQPEPSDI